GTTGKRVQQASVWVTPADGGERSCLIDATKGSFEWAGVPAGKYLVSANLNDDSVQMAGRITVDTRQKQKSLTIPLFPLTHIHGRIVVDGEASVSNLDLSRFSVNLQPDPDVDSGRLTFASVLRDGTFDIVGVMDWDYRVTLRSPETT